MTVILQIDVMNPLNKRDRQDIPIRSVNYQNTLSFRVCYDTDVTENHVKKIENMLLDEEIKRDLLTWNKANFMKQSYDQNKCVILIKV